jgi:hypothetical protein
MREWDKVTTCRESGGLVFQGSACLCAFQRGSWVSWLCILKGEREDKGEGTWAPLLICMRYFGYKVFDGKPRGNDGASFIFIYYFQFLRDRERGGWEW